MSIKSTHRSMIRYSNLVVKLYELGKRENNYNPFSYKDPFESDNPKGVEYPITLKKIVYSSDTSPTILSGTIADLTISKRNVVMNPSKKFSNDSSNSGSNPLIPYVGWGITVDVEEDMKHTDGAAVIPDNKVKRIFKGYISSISRQISQNGIFYDFEARDIKSRLTFQTIKKTYNSTYKGAGIPIVNEEKITSETEYDKPYISGNLTIKQILKDIIDYSKKTSSNGKSYDKFIGFTLNDFDFNNDSYLEKFIPPTISFDNITILEAIFKLINTAGPYRMVCQYTEKTKGDKIYFSSLDNRCKNCGKEVVLKYGIPGEEKEFSEVNVVSDTTYRKIYDSCNIMKAYTGQIEWYSGHFYIIKGHTETEIKGSARFGEYGESITKNILSCKNWDGYNYYFGLKSVPYGESVSENSNSDSNANFVIVGTPLYPAFDPNSGYGPYQSSFLTFLDDPDTPQKDLPANPQNTDAKQYICLKLNNGITENDRQFIKHRNFMDTVGRDRIKNSVGITYVAYVPYDVCFACKGTGAVEQDCSDAKYSHIFGNTRTLSGLSREALSFTPFDYQYKHATYEIAGKKGMQPYVGDGYLIPSRHPLPWKNTCPVCRGTGIEPWFKMGTILNSLVDISPSQAKIGELTNNRIGTVGGSLVLDKTYGEITEDMSYKYPVMIHTEASTNYIAYAYAAESNSNSWIAHPLSDTKQVEYHDSNTKVEGLNTSAKIFPNGSDGSTRAEDKDSKYVQMLYYTQIQDATGYQIDTDRSLVIFNNVNFIPYRAPMATVTEVMSKNGIKMPAYDKDLKCFKYSQKGEMNGVGQNVGSYWRPARAWITCYFKRDRFEEFSKIGGKKIERITDRDDVNDSDFYKIYPRIEDNRYCAEIRKTSKEENLEEFNTRPIARGLFSEELKWQVHPWDYTKMWVPSLGGNSSSFEVPTDYSNMWESDGIYDGCIKKKYYFPCGKLLKFEKMRDIEARTLASNNVDISQVLRSDTFGKILAWAHKDDRIKLFEKGCAELERRNNVQISGTVSIRGEIPCFKNGMGFVTLYDGLKACIVKVELNFGNNFLMNLEVGTEELRVGQKKEADKDYDRLIQDTLSDLKDARTSLGANGPVDTIDNSDNVTTIGAFVVGGGVEI